MKLSRWSILAPVPGRDTVLLVQPLSGQVAVLTAAEADALRNPLRSPLPALLDEAELREGRYVVDSDDDDQALLAEAVASFREQSALTATQLIVVPTFGCNLSCTYCYQEPFSAVSGLIEPAVIDSLFAWIDRFHGADEPPPYLTLFGGEPLRDTPAQRDRIGRLLAGARDRGLGVAVVTNGYDLEAYAEMLAGAPTLEVQVTLDGPPTVHDERRPHASGAGTFERIARGIEAMIAASIPVNLRVVVDRANLPALPELARTAEARGWLDLPATRFKTHVGRNYELFGCAAGQRRSALYSRAELWTAYLEIAEREPIVRRFYQPSFHGMLQVAQGGELPGPSFDACPAAKKEWAFAPDGSLYGCTATVGHPRFRLGRFHPTIERDEEAIAAWATRSTASIAACADCNLAPMCGGGCGALAAVQIGSPAGPDCRPVATLLGLGARFYGLDGLEDAPPLCVATTDCSRCAAPPRDLTPLLTRHGAGHGTPARSGCLGCGAALVYLQSAEVMTCAGCGAERESNARCLAGHYYCDACHRESAGDVTERLLCAATATDPVALAVEVMRHPKIAMHGPEHHVLAPAALVAAWCNLRGEPDRKPKLLAEVRRRAEVVPGGSCGFQGSCGAAVGAGIFVSIVTEATPLSTVARGHAMRVTAEALTVLSSLEAPRCCKRDTFLSLLVAARYARRRLGIRLPVRGPRCEHRPTNRECIGDRCPFRPR